MATPPGLYRLSRALGRVGIIVAVIILLYVGLTVYSASEIRVAGTGGNPTATVSQNVVNLTTGLTLENRGFLSITGVSVTSVIRFPDGTLLGVARSPVIAIAPASNATVPISIQVPLSGASQAVLLLTHSVHLPSATSANVTFGGIVTVHVTDSSGISWGAPFDSLNATVGTPSLQGNGTVAVPVHVTYTNRAPFDESGEFSYTLRSASGMSCAAGTVPDSVRSGQSFDDTVTVYLPPSCSLSGGSVELAFTGSGFSLVLPPEPIP
ncbi:MAG TPA: hypothetical protein VEY07_01605 [Thermoplasmata archaeon]|nr:hypothetical protein [Thermoplasmata archaeon]